MSDNFAVRIGTVSEVKPHPDSNKLDLVTISGYTNVANRPSEGVPRYKVGDLAVVLTENLILPEALIKHLDMWDTVKDKGGLGGNKGNRTKARKIGGVLSEVALCSVKLYSKDGMLCISIDGLINEAQFPLSIRGLDEIDMAPVLGITEYIPVG